jgi:hypothetical protein
MLVIGLALSRVSSFAADRRPGYSSKRGSCPALSVTTKAAPISSTVQGGGKRSWNIMAPLDEAAALRPNCGPCAKQDHGQRSASYSERRPGCGCGVSTVSITRPWLARSPSSCGGPRHQATNCGLAHAALPAAEKVRLSSARAGPAITLAFIHSRSASPTK